MPRSWDRVAVDPTRARPVNHRLSGFIFEDDDRIQGQKESSVLLRNVVKPEDVDDPISVGGYAYSPSPLRVLNSGLSLVEEILARTQTGRLMKIHDLPALSSTLELLTMLALSTGRFLKVRLLFSTQKIIFSPAGWHPRHPLCGVPFPHRLEPPKNAVLLRTTRAARCAYTFNDPR